jgi:hypothetical protein
MEDAAEMLWVVLANVSGGDWTKQSTEWQEAAARWRDNYFAALKAKSAPSVGSRPLAERLDTYHELREWMATALNVFLAPDGLVATDRTIDEFTAIVDAHVNIVVKEQLREAAQQLAAVETAQQEAERLLRASRAVSAEVAAVEREIPTSGREVRD